jgi:hypothetical protein
VTAATKLLSDDIGKHLIQEQPQPSASCARSQTRR